MREHLVGYLLNAVEPDEHRQVEETLAADDSLRRDLKLLEWSLKPLAADQDHHEPPMGLAQRCCQFVYSRTEVMPVALSPAGTIGGTVNRRRWSWLDLSVAAAVAIAAAVLLVPAIYQSNAHSRLLACQNNLKDIGYATASYSDRNGGYYPAAQPGDPVGKWAPMLASQGYLQQADRAMVCPSSPLADRKFHVLSDAELDRIVHSESPKELAAALETLSGSYGETLGYTDGEKVYRLHRKANRPGFVVFSDLPSEHAGNSDNHGRKGQNVLYGDGHVQYLSTAITPSGDNIFLNRNGEIGPGVDADDSVIVNAAYRAQQ